MGAADVSKDNRLQTLVKQSSVCQHLSPLQSFPVSVPAGSQADILGLKKKKRRSPLFYLAFLHFEAMQL
jgi:hypothetical protein